MRQASGGERDTRFVRARVRGNPDKPGNVLCPPPPNEHDTSKGVHFSVRLTCDHGSELQGTNPATPCPGLVFDEKQPRLGKLTCPSAPTPGPACLPPPPPSRLACRSTPWAGPRGTWNTRGPLRRHLRARRMETPTRFRCERCRRVVKSKRCVRGGGGSSCDGSTLVNNVEQSPWSGQLLRAGGGSRSGGSGGLESDPGVRPRHRRPVAGQENVAPFPLLLSSLSSTFLLQAVSRWKGAPI